MKTIFNVRIQKDGGGGTRMQKVADLSFLPPVGMVVEDCVWCDGRKVTGVRLSIDDEPILYVELEPERTVTDGDFIESVDRYKGCGWEEPGVDA